MPKGDGWLLIAALVMIFLLAGQSSLQSSITIADVSFGGLSWSGQTSTNSDRCGGASFSSTPVLSLSASAGRITNVCDGDGSSTVKADLNGWQEVLVTFSVSGSASPADNFDCNTHSVTWMTAGGVAFSDGWGNGNCGTPRSQAYSGFARFVKNPSGSVDVLLKKCEACSYDYLATGTPSNNFLELGVSASHRENFGSSSSASLTVSKIEVKCPVGQSFSPSRGCEAVSTVQVCPPVCGTQYRVEGGSCQPFAATTAADGVASFDTFEACKSKVQVPEEGCAVAGCSSEICTTTEQASRLISICLSRPEYNCVKLTSCGMVQGKCSWKENPQYRTCLGLGGVEPVINSSTPPACTLTCQAGEKRSANSCSCNAFIEPAKSFLEGIDFDLEDPKVQLAGLGAIILIFLILRR